VLPLGAQLRMADAIAYLGRTALPRMHGRVRDNVQHVLGYDASDADVERVAREQWRNYVRYMRDFAALPHSAGFEVDRILAAVQGWEYVDAAMAQGRGLVLVSVHLGNWDLAAGAMARRYPVSVIADTFSSSRLDGAINERRSALGLKVIPIEKAVKRTASALRRHEAVAFLVDKPLDGDDGVEVSFFGEPARIPAGAGYFASRLRAPIIVAFVWRNAERSFSAKVLPAISTEGDTRAIMQRIMNAAEQMIREQPEQWYMFRRMWPSQHSAETVKLEEAVA
jgi:Kdo2-lipid IVA lauroyltransferase/acyltransferase